MLLNIIADEAKLRRLIGSHSERPDAKKIVLKGRMP